MRLCFLGNLGSIHLQRWLRYCVERGHEVHYIGWRPQPVPVVGLQAHWLQAGAGAPASVVTRPGPQARWGVPRGAGVMWMGWRWQRAGLRRLLDRIRPDVLHGHVLTEHGFFAALSGYQPLMVSSWGSDVLLHPREAWGYRQIVGYALRCARLVHVQSAQVAERAQAFGVPATRILTTIFGIEDHWLEVPRSTQPSARPVIISTRALERVYDIATLIKAMALVRQRQPQAVLRLYGEGSLRPALEAQARRLGLGGVVEFHGSRPHEQLPALLVQGQVYVSASLSDSASVSLLEAMAVGLCPVVSDIPANRPWITEGENGLLFAPGDAPALARQLVQALSDSAWRAEAAARNKALVQARALWRDHMARIETAYAALAAGRLP